MKIIIVVTLFIIAVSAVLLYLRKREDVDVDWLDDQDQEKDIEEDWAVTGRVEHYLVTELEAPVEIKIDVIFGRDGDDDQVNIFSDKFLLRLYLESGNLDIEFYDFKYTSDEEKQYVSRVSEHIGDIKKLFEVQ